jgi:hypothetical protein
MSTTQDADLSLTYGPFTAPAGSVVDHIVVTATASVPANSPPPQNIAPRTATVTFSNLTPDTYTFTAQAADASGNLFGTPATTTLAITATTVTLQVPSAITATQP